MVGHEIHTDPIPPPAATVTAIIHHPAALVPGQLQAHARHAPASPTAPAHLHLAIGSGQVGARSARPHDLLSARHD